MGAGFFVSGWRPPTESQHMHPSAHQNRLIQAAPILSGTEFRQIETRSRREAQELAREAENKASRYSLRHLINSQLEWQAHKVDHAAVAAVREMSDLCKAQSGETPWGTWLPLAALTRDLTTSNTAALLTNGVSPTLQSALAPHSAVMGGATILSGLTGSGFSLPVVDTPVNAASAWIGEGNTGPTLEPSTRLATLAPKSLIFSLYVTRRLMMQTSADLEGILRTELLNRTMQAIEEAALAGAGPNAPAGLLNDPLLQVVEAGPNGAAPTWAQLAELEYQVSTRAGAMVSPAFITSPRMRKRYRTTQRAAGLSFILDDSATEVMGQPLRITKMMPDNLVKGTSGANCSALVFGDWAEVVVGFWGPLAVDILVDGTTQVKDGLIKLTVRCEVGAATRDIKAFAAYKDLLAA